MIHDVGILSHSIEKLSIKKHEHVKYEKNLKHEHVNYEKNL